MTKTKLFLLLPVIVAAALVLSGCTNEDDVDNSTKDEVNAIMESANEIIENNSTESSSTESDSDENVTTTFSESDTKAECDSQCSIMPSGVMYDTCYYGCFKDLGVDEKDYNYCLLIPDTEENSVGYIRANCLTDIATSEKDASVCGQSDGLAGDRCYDNYVRETGESQFCTEIEDAQIANMCANY